MIAGFRHKGLKRLFEDGDASGVRPDHLHRIRVILIQMHTADRVEDMASPGYDIHPLKGNRKGYWSVKVNKNWRIIFTFDGKEFDDVNLIDYH